MIHHGTLSDHERGPGTAFWEQVARHRLAGCLALARVDGAGFVLYFAEDEPALKTIVRAAWALAINDGSAISDRHVVRVQLPTSTLLCLRSKSVEATNLI